MDVETTSTTVSTVAGREEFIKGYINAMSSALRFARIPNTKVNIVSGVELWLLENLVAYTKSKLDIGTMQKGIWFWVNMPDGSTKQIECGQDRPCP